MNIFNRYINLQIGLYSGCTDQPETQASVFVVIPCYDEPEIVSTLESLASCYPPVEPVSVLIVVNDATQSSQIAVSQNIATMELIEEWQSKHPDSFFRVQAIYAHALPQKWAGVGWARKIGMDAAVRQIAKTNQADGIIVSLDADSKVSPNYLQSIEKAFKENPLFNFFTIHFEHPFENSGLSPTIREGIVRYELHMRYYRNALQWSGFPHAIHTVGSSFALKASAYVKQGGMNRRKAGEDFYFLQKLIMLEDYGNISSAIVYPESRISDRVPFGTGAALKKWVNGSSDLHYTYSLGAFGQLKPLFAHSSEFWSMEKVEIVDFFRNLEPSLQSFCEKSETVAQLWELKANCSTAKVFEKRFFHLLNAFWILKYLNFAHEAFLTRAELKTESVKLLNHLGINADKNTPIENILAIFRSLDKNIKPGF